MKNRCDDIYLLSVHFMGILTKYVPDEESQPNEADRAEPYRQPAGS